MAIFSVPVGEAFAARCLTVEDVMAVKEFERDAKGNFRETGRQASDRDSGLPMWELAVGYKPDPDRPKETVFVRVPSRDRLDGLVGLRPVFGGLEVSDVGRGKFRASSVSSEALKPSARASAAAPPAPAPERAAADNAKVPA